MHRLLHLLAIGPLAVLVLLAPAPPAAAATRCFPATGHCLEGRFLEYWEQNGGLPVFGYPITPARQERNRDTGQAYLTQWFERNRFELHPENARPYDVLLGRLGDDWLQANGTDWSLRDRDSGPQPGCLWFEATRLNICDQAPGAGFQSYWQQHGLQDRQLNDFQRSLALFGLPLTRPLLATNSSGDRVLTQWFERARFEWHPGNPRQHRVLLGLLGVEVSAPARLELSGTIAYTAWAANRRQIRLLDPARGSDTLLSSPASDELLPDWSPDGEWLAYTASDGMRFDIWRVRRDGTGRQRLTDSGSWPPTERVRLSWTALDPVWSPDGQWIAFTSGDNDQNYPDIYLMRPDGSERRALSSGSAKTRRQPDWSPDSRRIVYSFDHDIYVMSADGSQQQRLAGTPGIDRAPRWSPDGQWVAFERILGGTDAIEIYAVRVDGSGLVRLTYSSQDSRDPEWSPDGRFLLFSRRVATGSTLLVMPFEPEGAPAPLVRLVEESSFGGHSWSTR